MNHRSVRRCVLAGATGVLLLATVACGDPDAAPTTGPDTTSTPDDTTPDTEPATTIDGGAPLTIDGLAPDDLVLRVGIDGSNGGDEPRLVTLYADGTVVVPRDDSPTGFATFTVARNAIDDVLALAVDADLYGDVEYGEVEVTDVGSTVVTANTDAGPTVVSVWALSMDDGVSDEQADARRRLSRLVEALDSLQSSPGRNGDLETYTPPTIAVQVFAADDDGDEQAPTPWPLGDVAPEEWQIVAAEAGCIPVAATDLAAVLELGDEQVWTVPAGTTAAPPTVRVRLRAVQPADEACEGAPAYDGPRPLTPDEADAPILDVDVPWTVDTRTTVHPLERWAAEQALLTDVLPARIPGGGGWDRTRWSWFDVGVFGAEVDGQRFVDVIARCTDFVEDEEPACTILARFDAVTGELTEFQAT